MKKQKRNPRHALVRIDRGTHEKIKNLAVSEGRTVEWMYRKALTEWLACLMVEAVAR